MSAVHTPLGWSRSTRRRRRPPARPTGGLHPRGTSNTTSPPALPPCSATSARLCAPTPPSAPPWPQPMSCRARPAASTQCPSAAAAPPSRISSTACRSARSTSLPFLLAHGYPCPMAVQQYPLVAPPHTPAHTRTHLSTHGCTMPGRSLAADCPRRRLRVVERRSVPQPACAPPSLPTMPAGLPHGLHRL